MGVKSALDGGVKDLACSKNAFAAMKEDGSVVTRETAYFGGDSDTVKSDLQCSMLQVVGNYAAFAAIKEDGSVVSHVERTHAVIATR